MNIIQYKNLFLIIAGLIVTAAVVIVLTLGLKPGIDFTGGSLMEVRYTALPEKAVVEEKLATFDFGGTSVRQSESEVGSGYLVTTRALTDEERVKLSESLVSLGEGGEVSRFTSVGPVIGEELKDKAFWAIGIVLILTICYVAFAFSGIGWPVSSWVYGLITIIVLIHDILVPMAAMSLLTYFTGAEADILFVTVLLTILGYSVNDTIVIFDRVRDKLKQHRIEKERVVNIPGGAKQTETVYSLAKPFSAIVGQAVDETMARSINTSLTVLLALIALYFFGSSVTQNFILILMVGVIAGAYSSIFIANPLLVLYEEWKEKRAAATDSKSVNK
jgi:preprotein translocase subunit SecF